MPKAENIEAILLDKDGVFVNFQKLWLRMIAYRAQLIAEYSTDCWERFNQVRTACIRSMGVDEDEEILDPYAPCSFPEATVKVALKTATYLTIFESDPNYTWKEASDVVDRAFQEASEQLDLTEMTEEIEGSIAKIQEIAAAGYKLAVFSSDSQDNVEAALKKFGIADLFSEIQAGAIKDAKCYADTCKRMGISPEKTILVSDTPKDLDAARECGARSIGVLSGVVTAENIGILKVAADEILASLADLELKNISGPGIKA